MPTPDLGHVLTAATTYGDAREQAARDELQPQIASLTADRDRIQAEFDAYRAAHPDTQPEPDPEPEPEPEPTKPLPLLGMSAPADLWTGRKQQAEATGGRLQARRIFLSGLTAGLGLIEAAHREGLLPVASFKVGNDWAGIAAGRYDTQLKNLADRLKALGKPVVVCLHHEPDEQSTPPDQGEGGTAAQFAGMYRRATPILKTADNVQVWPIMNGWWWTDRAARLTDTQIDAWLPRDVRELVDGIAADDYSPEGSEPAAVKTRNRIAWAKRVGGVKALGIGETNAFTPADLTDVLNIVRDETLFRGGWALVWNSTGGTYRPLNETGLLDDFQQILRTWPR